MATFEDFLSEGKKIQIKRKYTENYPAKTVGKTANVRNAVIQAIKDGVVTREEFNKILSELSTSSSQWASRNRKYFNVSEEGIKLSKWGRRILAELDETPKAAEVFEATVEMDAINPDDKDFLKFLKKNKVKIINKEMGGPGGGYPVITMQGKRKDLEKVLADPELGWDDPDLAEYIEESVNEAKPAGLSKKETLKVAQKFAAALTKVDGMKYTVNSDYEEDSFDLDIEDQDDVDPRITGEYAGGSYNINADGSVVNMAVSNKKNASPVYGNMDDDIKTIIKTIKNIKESVVNEKDDAGDHLDKLAELVGKARDFFAIGKELKAGKYKYDYSDSMMPMYTIKADGFKFAILNKRYVDSGDREVGEIAIGLMENIKTEITNMETFSIHESFASFTGANGFLNEKLGSQILASILMGNKEGKYGKKNLAILAGGFYQLTKVALDKIQDEDFIVDNDPQKAFKNHGGSKNIIFFISDNEKENPYFPNGSYSNHQTIPGGGILLAAMGGDREFYTNDWSRYAKNRSWKKDGRKGSEDQIGVNKKYRGWDATGLSNGKRIAEVSDRVIIVNLDLIRQKYSTQQLRDARAAAKAGAIAFKSDKEFKAENKNRYHQILATKAASMPIDKMVEDAIDALATQIKDGLASGDKTRYDEIKIGETSKGREAKLRDASNHMSNILDNYSRYCNYIKQREDSVDRYGQSESYYEREAQNYAKEIKDQIAKIKGFDYAW